MDSRAKGRLALTIAAAVAFAALTCKTALRVRLDDGVRPATSNLNGVAANALPTYPEPTEEAAAEPVEAQEVHQIADRARRGGRSRARPSWRSARSAGKYAARKAKQAEQDDDEAPTRAKTATKVSAGGRQRQCRVGRDRRAPRRQRAPTAGTRRSLPPLNRRRRRDAQPPTIELVSADEFNDLDRAAWEANQMPKLMKLTGSDSRAELRDDDSQLGADLDHRQAVRRLRRAADDRLGDPDVHGLSGRSLQPPDA